IYDMKAGSFLAFHAVRSILLQKVKTRRPIVLLLTPDEEVGSPTSREWIEREAADAACVLIPEPAGSGGACVTARKGVGRFVMRVEGRGAHSGGAFEEGASAVVELARQIVRLHAMVDLERGITLNAAPVWGGSRPNVISPDAGCEIDLRVNSAADGERMERVLLGATALTPGCRVAVEGGMNRPPVAEDPGILALYDKARGVAEQIGITLPRQHRGGGSDGNFTAALGVPTLDGLGCPGSGAHASHEHILWQHLAPRAALMAGLLEVLGEGACAASRQACTLWNSGTSTAPCCSIPRPSSAASCRSCWRSTTRSHRIAPPARRSSWSPRSASTAGGTSASSRCWPHSRLPTG